MNPISGSSKFGLYLKAIGSTSTVSNVQRHLYCRAKRIRNDAVFLDDFKNVWQRLVTIVHICVSQFPENTFYLSVFIEFLRLFSGNFSKESHLMRERFEDRVQRTQILMRKVMERANRSVWRCDPRHHIEGETYVTVTRLLQGYIENEVDMNNDNTCRENCNAYQFTESYSCYKELFCARQPKCSGKLLNCQFFDSDMWICPSVRKI